MTIFNENQKIIMITGKGGVGKSTIAASVAQREAKKGKKTLLIEIGEHSYYQYVYKTEIQFEPIKIANNFYICNWRGESCLREYVLYLIKVQKIVSLFFDNKVMQTFIKAAPALKELAILGKITSGVRKWGPALNYDLIVVDGLATGHFLALLRAPIGMSELIESGPMGEHTRNMQLVLKNEKFCEYRIVTLPEELPVTETIELKADLLKTVGLEAKVICNKIYRPTLSVDELKQTVGTNHQQNFSTFLLELVARQTDRLTILEEKIHKYQKWPLVLLSESRSVIDALEESVL